MAGIFISYRRSASKHLAQLIFRELRQRGHDVFLDVTTIDSGAFDRIILNQIAARPHFILILSPGSLERCTNEGDWLRREIEEAFRLGRNIVPIFDEGFSIDREKQYLPAHIQAELPRLNAPPYSHYYFDAFIDTVANRFLKEPAYEIKVIETAPVERAEVERRIKQTASTPEVPPKPTRSTIYDILPAPFEWIDISAGNVTLEAGGYIPAGGKSFEVTDFHISKYPITNAQYGKFIDAGGYQRQKWWSIQGWQIKEQKAWIEPRHWRNTEWNGVEYPVIGISWYEAMAFCLWLSTLTGEKITLPTEQQWQRAAQGDDGRNYPWGNEWEGNRCNNSVKPFISNSTTPVRQYEGTDKGDSPFGVVDMIGNIWEWCTNDYFTQDNHSDIKIRYPVVRGGSWMSKENLRLRTSSRSNGDATIQDSNLGFRFILVH